jgi:mannonate dehydratase
VKELKAKGLTVGAAHIENPNLDAIALGRPDRDKAIEKFKTTIRAAGKAGIPVLQYTLYAHRLNEGLFDAPDPERGNALLESFDYQPVKDLPPLPNEKAHSHEELWANASYFIKEVVPVAEASNVRLAQHPNDAPGYVSRGSHQIMSTLEDWKRFVAIVDSPSNGITFDCGITREIGEDPVAAARYFGERDRINLVHYRNVIMRTPREFYTETYPDMGDADMFAIMKELVRVKYNRSIIPEHPRGLDVDRDTKNGNYAAWALQVGYARAMLQVALMER